MYSSLKKICPNKNFSGSRKNLSKLKKNLSLSFCHTLFLLMSTTIYLIYRCPYCHVNTTRPGLLRDHLENLHTLKCNFTKERRRVTKEITFVTESTVNSRTCFGCCFCKMFFDDEAVFKNHIENDHVITAINVSASMVTVETEGKVRKQINEALEKFSITFALAEHLITFFLLQRMRTKALLFSRTISIKRLLQILS
ncbi:MAG: hypothetical protein EXX96DRAFT_169939 [Benjaminiella poitrasii]|nr:MAG: hypothetical protein EXX96DRAFT_169939 [Benjaminiella poitrasii]